MAGFDISVFTSPDSELLFACKTEIVGIKVTLLNGIWSM
jgi:hypothetical protein